jgi:hypothetical protein
MNRCSLAEACELLESSPSIKQSQVHIMIVVGQQVSIRVTICLRRVWECCDKVLDADEWRRFGSAVRNSALSTLYLFGCMSSKDYVHVIDGELSGAATRCIDAFLAAVKHNKPITKALFNLKMGMSVDELSGCILNNKALKKLYLESWEPVPLVQSTVLSRAIGSVHLTVRGMFKS